MSPHTVPPFANDQCHRCRLLIRDHVARQATHRLHLPLAAPLVYRRTMTGTLERRPRGTARTIVLCEPPFLFWDRSMDRLRQGEETIPGMGMLVLAAVARQRGYQVHLI